MSCLENPMDRGAWWAAVHGVAKSRTRLSDFTFTFHFHALGKEMATHCSVLAWRIPGMGHPGGLLSMGSHRVRHDWSDSAAAGRYGLRPKLWGICHKYQIKPGLMNYPKLNDHSSSCKRSVAPWEISKDNLGRKPLPLSNLEAQNGGGWGSLV